MGFWGKSFNILCKTGQVALKAGVATAKVGVLLLTDDIKSKHKQGVYR